MHWARDTLQGKCDWIASIRLHSMKASFLSFAAQTGESDSDRAVQGHHKLGSVALYGRDDVPRCFAFAAKCLAKVPERMAGCHGIGDIVGASCAVSRFCRSFGFAVARGRLEAAICCFLPAGAPGCLGASPSSQVLVDAALTVAEDFAPALPSAAGAVASPLPTAGASPQPALPGPCEVSEAESEDLGSPERSVSFLRPAVGMFFI